MENSENDTSKICKNPLKRHPVILRNHLHEIALYLHEIDFYLHEIAEETKKKPRGEILWASLKYDCIQMLLILWLSTNWLHSCWLRTGGKWDKHP